MSDFPPASSPKAPALRAGGESCHFGVVFALGIEAGCTEDLLHGVVTLRGQGFVVRQGELRGRRIVLVQSGPGRTARPSAAESLLDGHHPAVVISAGFAGGLRPKLRRGDIVVADRVLDESGRQCAVDLAVLPASMTETSGVHVGGLLTVDRVVRLPEEKRALGEKYAALAADMETLAVAEVCRRRETPFLAVRVINDAADDALPRDVEKLLAQRKRRRAARGRRGLDPEASLERDGPVATPAVRAWRRRTGWRGSWPADDALNGEKGDSPHLPERPKGCFAQMGTVPFFPSAKDRMMGRHGRSSSMALDRLRRPGGRALGLGPGGLPSPRPHALVAGIGAGHASWCSLAAAFNGLLWWWRGNEAGIQFLTGYLVEWSLSMDNVFVFAVIFRFFQVPVQYQYRVLFWGILGAIVLRLAFVLAGTQLIHRFRLGPAALRAVPGLHGL